MYICMYVCMYVCMYIHTIVGLTNFSCKEVQFSSVAQSCLTLWTPWTPAAQFPRFPARALSQVYRMSPLDS